MSNTPKTLESIYTDILATIRYSSNAEGFIQKSLPGGDDEKTQVIVGGKSLVFPNDVQLSQPDWSKRYAFHPMREDFSSGFSPVFEDYRRRLNFTLSLHAGYIMLAIADMATKDGAFQKSLPQNVADYLHHVKDGDTDFKELVFGIMAADPTKFKSEMEWIRINVQKGRKVANEQRKRTATVTFPILERLQSHSKENKVDRIAGVKVRPKDRAMLQSLYKLLFPMAETPDAYTTWSDSLQAPSMDCLMRCAAPIIERINEIAAVLIGHTPNIGNLIISYNWKQVFDNLDQYTAVFNSLPMLNGNTGAGRVVDVHQPISSIKLQTQEQAAATQAAIPTDGRTISVSTPTGTPAVAAPVQPVVLNQQPAVQPVVQTTIHLDQQPNMQVQQPGQSLAAFRLDAPRGGALNTAPAVEHVPAVVKHDPVTPAQITQQSTPLFGNVQQPQPVATVATVGGVVQSPVMAGGFAMQAPVQMQVAQLPQGQPTVVNTAAGQIFVYPNGVSLTAQQVAQIQAQQQQMNNMNNLAALGTNPAMQQLMAMNPNNALIAAAAQLGGGMLPGQFPMVGAGMPMAGAGARTLGGAYQPLTQVNQVIPGYGLM